MLEQTVIYTTGAFLVPQEVTLNGEIRWVWIVTLFEDDTFLYGDEFNPPEVAKTLEELIVPCGE